MIAAEIMSLARAAGVAIRLDAGRIVAGPKGAVTDELRQLIRDNKTALIRALAEAGTAHVADVAHVAAPMGERPKDLEARRQRVLALLRASTGARLAFVVEDDTTDPVMVYIAFRDADKVTTCEVEIPFANYDGFRMLELAEKWGDDAPGPAAFVSRELIVLDGGKVRATEQAKSLDSSKEAA